MTRIARIKTKIIRVVRVCSWLNLTLFENHRQQARDLSSIIVVEPFAQFERFKIIVFSGGEKFRDVMHKTFEFEDARAGFETRFASLILLEWVQLAEIKSAARAQDAICFREDEINVFDVFERERTGY